MIQNAANEAMLREAAYHLWLKDGQPEGRAEHYWFRAMETLKTEPAKPRKAAATKRRSQSAAAKSSTAKPRARKAAAKKKPRTVGVVTPND